MICGVILAAGDSSRMASPKALLTYRGKTFLETVCDNMRAAGVYDITVVLGRHQEQILAGWKRNCERVAANPNPSDGQLSSVNTGLSALPQYASAVLLALVDQPTVSSDSYEDLVKTSQANPDAIIIPRCNGKRGHPIILPPKAWPLCAKAPLDKGLHWVTHHPDIKVVDLELTDTGILRDIDTPADYELLSPGGKK